MIQIEEIKLENFRGVRELTLLLGRENFAIQGPNATGKSCVVDGIEFGLTGKVSRLCGEDTKDLSVSNHAPHVDSQSNPESAKVTLRLYLADTKKTFTVTRSVKKPNAPKIKPDTPEARAALAMFSKRDEITLTRRQIVKYILTQATKRGERVQQLLRLEEVGKTRKAMASAVAKCKTTSTAARIELSAAEESARRHFNLPTLNDETMLGTVNTHRARIGMTAMASLGEGPCCETRQDEASEGLTRATAIRDLRAFREATEPKAYPAAGQTIERLLQQLDQDPHLNQALRTHELVQLGMDLVDNDFCPLCDAPRPLHELKTIFEEKLKRADRAAKIAEELSAAIGIAVETCQRVVAAARTVWKVADTLKMNVAATTIKAWAERVKDRGELLGKGHSAAVALRHDLESLVAIAEIEKELGSLEEAVRTLPDQSATIEATKFLADADNRITQLQQRQKQSDTAGAVLDHANYVHNTYCRVSAAELESLYQSVEESFSNSYRNLHSDDEGQFAAKFLPNEGKLDMEVDFHGRGMYPPGAYHSEGHQDSMGLCLYLALMKQVFGDDLRLIVLDDVVMSVDSGHRREICRLLKEEFPDTQFVITTHEEAWFQQMQTTRLVERKRARMFQSWTPEQGPVVSDIVEAWGKIDEHLSKNEVPAASGALRRHLEFILPQIADALQAKVQYSFHSRPEAGVFLCDCHLRLADLLRRAIKSAGSWDDDVTAEAASERLKELTDCLAETQREGKYINATIHFNQWASLVKQDFIPVVNAYRRLLASFQCQHCETLLRRSGADMLTCDCKKTLFNLQKQKIQRKATLPAR